MLNKLIIIASTLLTLVFAVPAAQAAVDASACAGSGPGLTCLSGKKYCSAGPTCYDPTTQAACAANTHWDCSACACVCDNQTGGSSCSTGPASASCYKDSETNATKVAVYTGSCSNITCPSGRTFCATNSTCRTNRVCPAGTVWDVCTDICSTPYILQNPSGAQSVTNDITFAGNETVSGNETVGGSSIIGNATPTLSAAGQNLIYGNVAAGSSLGSLFKLQKGAVNRFVIDLSGNTALAGNLDVQGGTISNSVGGTVAVSGNFSVSGTTSFGGGFSGDGSAITNLNASNIATGTLNDARLSANIPRLNANNVFTGNNTFSGMTSLGANTLNLGAGQNGIYESAVGGGAGNLMLLQTYSGGVYTDRFKVDTAGNVTGVNFSGNGAGLTSVSASGLASGTYANAVTFSSALNTFNGNFTATGGNKFNGDGTGLTGVCLTTGTNCPANLSPWSRTAPNVSLVTGTDNVGIGTATPGFKLEVDGTSNVIGGIATAAGGVGVWGSSAGANGQGVYGNAAGLNGIAISGDAPNGAAAYGVRGTGTTGVGGVGTTNGMTASGPTGILANATNVANSTGGYFTSSIAGSGSAKLAAQVGGVNYAGYFTGNNYVTGNQTIGGMVAVGGTAITPGAGQSLLYGVAAAGGAGNLALLQTYSGGVYTDRFKVDSTGVVTAGNLLVPAGTNYGITAYGNLTAITGYTSGAGHYGVIGDASAGSGIGVAGVGGVGVQGAGQTWGVTGRGEGPTNAIGGYFNSFGDGNAMTASLSAQIAGVNYAGYFSGNTYVTGNTTVVGNLTVNGTVTGPGGILVCLQNGTNCPATVSVTGTTNYIPKFTTANSLGNSIVFDNGTNVGIGTATPSAKLDVAGAISANGGATFSGVTGVSSYGSGAGVYGNNTGAGNGVSGYAANAGAFGIYGYNSSGAGIQGKTGSVTGYGVYGYGGSGISGIYGDTLNNSGYGVYGNANPGTGVFGKDSGGGGIGVRADGPNYALQANNTNGGFNGTALYAGHAFSGTGVYLASYDAGTTSMYAMLATGDVNITGNFSVSGSPSASAINKFRVYNGGMIRVGNLAADGSANNGSMYYNTATNKLRCVEAGVWKDCIGGGGGLSGSGSTNYVTKFTGASSVGNSQIQDDGTNVGVGMAPSYKLDVSGSERVSGPSASNGYSPTAGWGFTTGGTSYGAVLYGGTTGLYTSGTTYAIQAYGGPYGVYASGSTYSFYGAGGALYNAGDIDAPNNVWGTASAWIYCTTGSGSWSYCTCPTGSFVGQVAFATTQAAVACYKP